MNKFLLFTLICSPLAISATQPQPLSYRAIAGIILATTTFDNKLAGAHTAIADAIADALATPPAPAKTITTKRRHAGPAAKRTPKATHRHTRKSYQRG